MLKPESMLHSILGSISYDIRPLACAIEIAKHLLFSQHFDMDDIKVTKHIYSYVAKELQKTPYAVAKAIERLTPLCWNALVLKDLLPVYIGDPSMQMPPPKTLIIYLAVYAHFEIPFSLAVELYPDILFPSVLSTYFPTSLSNIDIMKVLRCAQPLPVIYREESYPICPNCSNKLIRTFQHYCDHCSQCLDWSHYKTTKSLTSSE